MKNNNLLERFKEVVSAQYPNPMDYSDVLQDGLVIFNKLTTDQQELLVAANERLVKNYPDLSPADYPQNDSDQILNDQLVNYAIDKDSYPDCKIEGLNHTWEKKYHYTDEFRLYKDKTHVASWVLGNLGRSTLVHGDTEILSEFAIDILEYLGR